MSGHSGEEERFVIVADARRRWSRAEKQTIVAECEGGASSVSAVARKHNIASSLLFRWRREFGGVRRPARAKPEFVPVGLPALRAPEGPALPIASDAAGRAPGKASITTGGLIEIELVGGRRLRIDGSVDAAALRRVIAVLEGR
jgi:transposase